MGIGLNAAFYEAEAAGRFFDEVLHEENKPFKITTKPSQKSQIF